MAKDTKDVIKLLPIKDSLKKDLVERFDSMSIGDRHDLMMLVYTIYDTMVNDMIEDRFRQKLEDVAEGRTAATSGLYNEAVQEAQKDLLGHSEAATRVDQLAGVRNKLQTIISSD